MEQIFLSFPFYTKIQKRTFVTLFHARPHRLCVYIMCFRSLCYLALHLASFVLRYHWIFSSISPPCICLFVSLTRIQFCYSCHLYCRSCLSCIINFVYVSRYRLLSFAHQSHSFMTKLMFSTHIIITIAHSNIIIRRMSLSTLQLSSITPLHHL